MRHCCCVRRCMHWLLAEKSTCKKYRWQFTPHKKLSCGSITTALLLKLLGSLGKDTEKVQFLLTSLYGLWDLYDLCYFLTRTFYKSVISEACQNFNFPALDIYKAADMLQLSFLFTKARNVAFPKLKSAARYLPLEKLESCYDAARFTLKVDCIQ